MDVTMLVATSCCWQLVATKSSCKSCCRKWRLSLLEIYTHQDHSLAWLPGHLLCILQQGHLSMQPLLQDDKTNQESQQQHLLLPPQFTQTTSVKAFLWPRAATGIRQGPQKDLNIPPPLVAAVAAVLGQRLWMPIWNLPVALSINPFNEEAVPAGPF